MRDKKTIRLCGSKRDGIRHGELEKLNDRFYKCKRCGSIIGSELARRR